MPAGPIGSQVFKGGSAASDAVRGRISAGRALDGRNNRPLAMIRPQQEVVWLRVEPDAGCTQRDVGALRAAAAAAARHADRARCVRRGLLPPHNPHTLPSRRGGVIGVDWLPSLPVTFP